jgi:hypothetical protein
MSRKISWPFVGRALVRFFCFALILGFAFLLWRGIISLF